MQNITCKQPTAHKYQNIQALKSVMTNNLALDKINPNRLPGTDAASNPNTVLTLEEERPDLADRITGKVVRREVLLLGDFTIGTEDDCAEAARGDGVTSDREAVRIVAGADAHLTEGGHRNLRDVLLLAGLREVQLRDGGTVRTLGGDEAGNQDCGKCGEEKTSHFGVLWAWSEERVVREWRRRAMCAIEGLFYSCGMGGGVRDAGLLTLCFTVREYLVSSAKWWFAGVGHSK